MTYSREVGAIGGALKKAEVRSRSVSDRRRSYAAMLKDQFRRGFRPGLN